MKPFDLIGFANADQLAHAVAQAWLEQIEAANRAGSPHRAALSGGRIAPTLFASTVEQAKSRSISFRHAHFFWADERCVPPDDAESNFQIARRHLLAPLRVPKNQIHRIHGEDPPESAAEQAEAEIRRVAPLNDSGQPVLDLILLGMGQDGHVASLFPGGAEESLSSKAAYHPVRDAPKPPPDRVTLGYSAIASAHAVWVLVTGLEKQTALRESMARSGTTPLARVLGLRSCTRIFADTPFGLR